MDYFKNLLIVLTLCVLITFDFDVANAAAVRVKRQQSPNPIRITPPSSGGGNNGGPRISGGALHVPVGSGGNSLFVGRPPTSGGFGYGAGANFRHGGGGNTWVGGSPQNGGTLGVGGSFGLGRGGGGGGGSTIQWGAGYSPSDQSFRARVAVQFRKRR